MPQPNCRFFPKVFCMLFFSLFYCSTKYRSSSETLFQTILIYYYKKIHCKLKSLKTVNREFVQNNSYKLFSETLSLILQTIIKELTPKNSCKLLLGTVHWVCRRGARGLLWGPWNILGIYWWAMKCFSKFLMGHEIFSYVLFS